VKLEAPKLHYSRPSPELDAVVRGAPAQTAAGAAHAGAPAEPTPRAEAETAAEPAGAPLEVRVGSFELSKGRLAFGDGTLSAPFRTAVRDLSVRARDLRWPGPAVGDLKVRGVAPERAPFSLAGSARDRSGEFAFEIQRLDLPAFDPYAARAGYHLAQGSASLRSSVRIEPARYVSQNELELHDLRLDSAESGAFERQFGTSLDLALALLRTPSGDIRLPIPLTVERENLRVGLGTLVLGAVRSALLGVVSSPLKALGAALPGGGEGEVDASALAAAPGSPDLLPDESARVKALRKLLRTRPLLAATLSGQAGPADRDALALALLRERAAAGESLPEVPGGGFFASRRVAEALREGTEGALAGDDAALYERMLAAAEVPAERFSDLARRRAEALRERLVTGKRPVDAARVVAAEPAEGEPGVGLELVARTEEVAP
jgi:hypothetical protein